LIQLLTRAPLATDCGDAQVTVQELEEYLADLGTSIKDLTNTRSGAYVARDLLGLEAKEVEPETDLALVSAAEHVELVQG
jgi:hypothetical protein